MNKGKIARLVGFIGALGISTVLVATAVTGTGAYFTDSKGGSINAGSGHLTLNITDTTLNFADLVPGEYKTVNIDYNTNSSSNSDVWMVFADSAAYCAFTGAKNGTFCADGGLGRFGHFAVANNNDVKFTSYNLQNTPADATGQSLGSTVTATAAVPSRPPAPRTLAQARSERAQESAPFRSLTDRERAALGALCDGLTVR